MRPRSTSWQPSPITSLIIDVAEGLPNEWSAADYNAPAGAPESSFQGVNLTPGYSARIAPTKPLDASDIDAIPTP